MNVRTSAFGTVLRHFREAAGLSQELLAERAELSLRGISDLERGVRTTPRLETVRMLADGLGLDEHERAELLAARGVSSEAVPRPPTEGVFRLPTPSTPFFGREREIAMISGMLASREVRLLTLTGPGGVGKTRLAIQTASTCGTEFPDGVFFVPLASIRNPELVPSALHKALGLKESGISELVSQVIRSLVNRHVLMVLDNFEQVSAAAPVIAAIMTECPDLSILATSRAPLNVSGEREYPISTLAIPDWDAKASLDQLARSEAVQMFVERARSVNPDFALTPENANDVVAICRQMDGLPLAIELAAARIKVLSPSAILQRLEHRLPLLTGGRRDMPARQQAMSATIEWSYNLLTSADQRFFRQVSIFAGGFKLEAAEAVAGPEAGDAHAVLDHVSTLVNHSLLRPMESPSSVARYVMLETIREFAEQKLAESGETDIIRGRHAAWCVTFMACASATIEPRVTPDGLKLIEAEYANMRPALQWLMESGKDVDLLRLIGNLGWYWYVAGHLHEGSAWSNRALERKTDQIPGTVLGKVYLRSGHLALELGDPRATEMLKEARRLFHEAGEVSREGSATLLLGMIAEDSGQYDEAEALFEASRKFFARPEDRWHYLAATYHLGVVAMGRRNVAQALSIFDAVYDEARQIGDLLLPAWCIFRLALLAFDEDDAGLVAQLLGRYPEPDNQADTIQLNWLNHLLATAALATTLGDTPAAARALGAASARWNDVPIAPPEGDFVARIEARARDQVGDQAFTEAWTVGRKMSSEELRHEIDRLLAVAETAQYPTPSGEGDATALLTPRECEVLALLVEGRTNREIADALFISRRTATTHVTNILAKFGVETRAAAVTYAFTHGLA